MHLGHLQLMELLASNLTIGVDQVIEIKILEVFVLSRKSGPHEYVLGDRVGTGTKPVGNTVANEVEGQRPLPVLKVMGNSRRHLCGYEDKRRQR